MCTLDGQHLELSKLKQQQLHLRHVRLDPQSPRFRRYDSQIQRQAPKTCRRGSVEGRVQPVLYPRHVHVPVGCDYCQTGYQAGNVLKDDGLAAHVHQF